MPGFGDAIGAAAKGVKLAAKVGKTAAAVEKSAAIGTRAGQVARAVAIGVGENLAEQTARVWTGQQDSIHWEQTLGAAVSGGLLGHATVGVGRALNASRSAVARTAVLGLGTGFAGAAGDAVTQLGAMAAGRQEGFDLTRSGLAFAGGALGGALGQAAYDKTCFRAGTPLVWEHGYRKVEEFQVGDRLAARSEFDPEGAIEWKAIEEVFVRRGLILEVTVAGQTIGTTAEHPFYLHGKGWTPAGELTVGDLLAASDGRWLPVESIYNTGALGFKNRNAKMKNSYKLLVYYDYVESPITVARTVVRDWESSGRPPLLYVENKERLPINIDGLNDILTFSEDKETVSAGFRSDAKDPDSVELLFANPAWKYRRSVNSCAIYLSADRVRNCQTGYSRDSVLTIFSKLVRIGRVRSAMFDATGVLYCDIVDELERKRAKVDGRFPSILYSLTYIPSENRSVVLRHAAKKNSGICVLRDLQQDGLVVGAGDFIASSASEHLEMLVKLNKELGVV